MMPFKRLVRGPAGGQPRSDVGQLNVAGIAWGSLCSGPHRLLGGRAGGGPRHHPDALALADGPLFPDGRPAPRRGQHPAGERAEPPGREKLGFREEGLRRAYLHIDGGWRDHIAYALTAPEVPEGMVNRCAACSPVTPYELIQYRPTL